MYMTCLDICHVAVHTAAYRRQQLSGDVAVNGSISDTCAHAHMSPPMLHTHICTVYNRVVELCCVVRVCWGNVQTTGENHLHTHLCAYMECGYVMYISAYLWECCYVHIFICV
eukprot:GHVS01030446.1.p1 GENE.GHVS01030446.1~~GHVS01030446.1.p1  ORF type:complete len:113 (+),score=12.62 GHVS01030446.1:250-588(+)